jgi:RNA polymerase sigma factor (TIGR02999 family)
VNRQTTGLLQTQGVLVAIWYDIYSVANSLPDRHPAEHSERINSLMRRFRGGDRLAAGELVDCLYPELHRLASSRMYRERQEHTWTPTILINELYLELVKIRALRPADVDASERDAFLKLSGFLMRRLLIHHARPLAKKAQKVPLSDIRPDLDLEENGLESLTEVEAMLDRLAAIDPKLRVVVEMRVFEGQSLDDIARAVDCSARTVSTHWNFAKRWLQREFELETDVEAPSEAKAAG